MYHQVYFTLFKANRELPQRWLRGVEVQRNIDLTAENRWTIISMSVDIIVVNK